MKTWQNLAGTIRVNFKDYLGKYNNIHIYISFKPYNNFQSRFWDGCDICGFFKRKIPYLIHSLCCFRYKLLMFLHGGMMQWRIYTVTFWMRTNRPIFFVFMLFSATFNQILDWGPRHPAPGTPSGKFLDLPLWCDVCHFMQHFSCVFLFIFIFTLEVAFGLI